MVISALPELPDLWPAATISSTNPSCWSVKVPALLPVGLDQPLHLLRLSLNPDVCLELPQRLIQLHGCEVHLIHHTAEEQPSDSQSRMSWSFHTAGGVPIWLTAYKITSQSLLCGRIKESILILKVQLKQTGHFQSWIDSDSGLQFIDLWMLLRI